MALTFGALTSDVVDCGSGASIDAFTTPSFLAWVFPTTLAITTRLATKTVNTNPAKVYSVRNTGQLDMLVQTSGTGAQARSANSAGNILTTGSWFFVAMTLSSGLVPQLYLGTLTTLAVEVSYVTQTTGSGTVIDDSATSFRIGNADTLNLAFVGRIAWVGYYNAQLTLAEIQRQQYHPQVIDSVRLFMHLGLVGTGTQPDWSGNGNTGTVTGATVGDHVPLGGLFGGRYRRAYAVAAGPGVPVFPGQMCIVFP